MLKPGRIVLLLLCVACVQCGSGSGDDEGHDGSSPSTPTSGPAQSGSVRILLLHHSTGQNVWDGGVPGQIAAYNAAHGTAYQIEERAYPDDPWPWDNYPSDYYRIWVLHEGG